MSTQKVIFSLVLLASLAALSQANVVVVNKAVNTPPKGTPNTQMIHLHFQRLLDYLMSLFRPKLAAAGPNLIMHMLGRPEGASQKTLKPSSGSQQQRPQAPAPQAAAQNQVVSSSSSTECHPACVSGSQCCLLVPGASAPSCQDNRLAGQSCGWNHYSSSNPSTTEALHNSSCPCLLGMGCVSATASKNGVCTFF
ncbi:hypothetical protein ACOMHN_056762 [Nucella lapillus]